MKVFVALAALAALASGAIVPDYPAPAGDAYAAAPSYGNDGYGQPQCRDVFETATKEHCEQYTDQVCTTSQKETCQDEPDQTCRGVVQTKQSRKCFQVNEQRCSLKEDVQTKTIQIEVAVQKCSKAFETICDTVYDVVSGSQSRQQCITVTNPKCTSVAQTVHDRTCRTTTTFDCDTSYAGGDYSDDSGYAAGGDAYGSSSDAAGYSSTSGYGQPKPNCRRSQDTKCYKTPRQVMVPQCTSVASQVCENLIEQVPQVKPRQACRKEEKRVCQLIKRQQPKQIKEFVYAKQCRSVPRQVCGDADQKTLAPSCVPATRKRCAYHPVESCEDQPKNKCFQFQYKVRKQQCDKAGYSAGGAAASSSAAYPADGGDGY